MIKINLLGKEEIRQKKASFALDVPLSIVIIISVFLIEIVGLGVFTYMTNDKIDRMTTERNNLSRLEKEVRRIKARISEVKRMVKAVKSLEKDRGKAAMILAEIANTMPEGFNQISNSAIKTYGGGLWLVSVSKNGKVIKIKGKSFTPEAVADYMIRLGTLKNVEKVRFDGSGLKKLSGHGGVDVYSFSIVVTLKG
ncbi:PilN domain-containing protein [Hippea maritima]|uniref:Fimbrial assembly family protein n=1 Tax=Hippea maritima (strain ATCC 700847 / DSM 10411 / MH2) TaxID=760142 RepID=F2LWW6_HIPMA|nr:PilN domain-containing protein [Hippea maritima]AEA34150.1 Fimbrial assembly family protein [Hippea maritima DSM 10411]